MTERPTASPAHFPYCSHRTIEQVDLDEAAASARERYREIARTNLRDWRKKPRG